MGSKFKIKNVYLDKATQQSIFDQVINKDKCIIGSGITSSHLGDERNLREYLFSNEVCKFVKSLGKDVDYYLADDSYDPLDYRQLRIAVKKDPILLSKFERYCGTPISLIPDPYECHDSYSHHFQEETLKRFDLLDIHPRLIDIYEMYELHKFEEYKKCIFQNYDHLKEFLNDEFPGYQMKKIFWPLCESCGKIDNTNIKRVTNDGVTYECTNCHKLEIKDYTTIKGKFSWKIDCAIKWNVFGPNFEAFNVSYLDPNVGSYYIAKKISKKFFAGAFPKILEYRQVSIPTEYSYKLLEILPKSLFIELFLDNVDQYLKISTAKLIQYAKSYNIDKNISYLDYIKRDLSTEILTKNYSFGEDFAIKGCEYSRTVLNKSLLPNLPTKAILSSISDIILEYIVKLLNFVSVERQNNSKMMTYDDFHEQLEMFLSKNKIARGNIFPSLRLLFGLASGQPMSKSLYLMDLNFINGALLTIKQNEV